MKRVLGLTLIGAFVGAGVQPLTPGGWWLDSGRGVAIAGLVFTVLAAVTGARFPRWPGRSADVRPIAAMWGGVNVGMAIVLFSVGPGNLFPIVLAVGAALSAAAVAAGTAAGVLAARVLRKPD
jgi:hypothetical protein